MRDRERRTHLLSGFGLLKVQCPGGRPACSAIYSLILSRPDWPLVVR
jgi:hypothetical protein